MSRLIFQTGQQREVLCLIRSRTLKNDYKLKSDLEKELLQTLNGKSWPLRKKIKEIKLELQKEKNELTKKH